MQPGYPPAPGWAPPPPPPRRGTPAWVWVLVGCGVFALLIFIGFGILIARVGKTVGTAIGQAAAEAENASRDLKVVEHNLTSYQGKRYLVGSLKNNSTKDTYDSISVDFALYDKAGNELDETAVAETETKLKPGAVWKFKVEVDDRDAVKAQAADVSGFRVGAMKRILGVEQNTPGGSKKGLTSED